MKLTPKLLCTALLACFVPMLLQAQENPVKSVHTYRVTYTLTTIDAGKQVGMQHYSLNVGPPSNRGTFKLGEKIPVATGSYSGEGKNGVQTQFTYLDVGLNIDASVTEDSHGIQLTSKVEQSSVAPIPSVIEGVSEPIIRQTVLTNSSVVYADRPVVLGSLDIPDTTRHIEIEATVQQVP